MATQQLNRHVWVAFLLIAALMMLCPGCGGKTVTPDRLAVESDSPAPCPVDSQGMAPEIQVGTWSGPNEWSTDGSESGTSMGCYEPADSSNPESQTARDEQWSPRPMGDRDDSSSEAVISSTVFNEEWSPQPMGDGDDSGGNVVTGSAANEDDYRWMIVDTLNAELEEQMQAVPETPNTETDEANGLVGDEDSGYRDEESPPSLTEDEGAASQSGQTNDGNYDPAAGSPP